MANNLDAEAAFEDAQKQWLKLVLFGLSIWRSEETADAVEQSGRRTLGNGAAAIGS